MSQNSERNKPITIDYVEDEVLVAVAVKKLLEFPEVMVRNVLYEIEEAIRTIDRDPPPMF